MAKWAADTRYIASIYPGDLEAVAYNHGPSPDRTKGRRTVYRLTPVPRETARTRPCVIEVADGFEDVLNPMGGSFGNKYQPKPVDADETVRCLLQHWTGNMVGVPAGASPGIILIANTFPTKAEMERMFEMQTLYFEWGYQEGERLHRENSWKEITAAMKIGAAWLGKDTIWSNPARVSEMVNCPACGEEIQPKVAVCKHCRTRLRALPKEIAILNQTEPEPVVAA